MTEKPETVRVKVKSRQPKTQIIKEENGIIHIALHAPPVDGKANIELVKFLSRHFRKKAEIISGKSSKEKLVKLG